MKVSLKRPVHASNMVTTLIIRNIGVPNRVQRNKFTV